MLLVGVVCLLLVSWCVLRVVFRLEFDVCGRSLLRVDFVCC